MMKKMTIVIIAFLTILIEYLVLLWLLKDIPVFADSFYPKGEINQCEFIPAVGVAIQSLPSQGVNNLTYDVNQVNGVSESWVYSHTIHDVANVYSGQSKRYPNIAGNVSVPPNTKITVGFWWLNFSGHPIRVLDSSLFLSQKESPAGFDISRVIADQLLEGRESYWQNNIVKTREGKVLQTGDLGLFYNTSISNPPVGKRIATLNVIQPIQVKEKSSECHISETGEVIMQKRVVLHNVSQYMLDNVGSVNENTRFSVMSGEQKELLFEENKGKVFQESITGAAISIIDPNSHRECAVNGSTRGDSTDPSTRVMLVKRNDSVQADWWAIQPDLAAVPQTPYFCITQIPYTVTIGDFSCKLEQLLLPDLEFGKEGIHPGESQTFSITISNEGIGIHSEIVKLIIPKSDFNLFSGFAGAIKISEEGQNVILEYPILDLESKSKLILTDAFTANEILPPEALRDFNWSVSIGVKSDKDIFTVSEDILKNVEVAIESMNTTSSENNITIELTERVAPFSIAIVPTVNGVITSMCGGNLSYDDIVVTLHSPVKGRLFFDNGSQKDEIINEMNVSLTTLLSGRLALEETASTTVEIPIKLSYPESEKIAVSLDIKACSYQGCKSSGVILQNDYSRQCADSHADVSEKVSNYVIVPGLISQEEISAIISLPDQLVGIVNEMLWSGSAIPLVSRMKGDVLANTGINLIQLFYYSAWFSFMSAAVMFLIFKRVSKSKGSVLPIN